MSTAWILSDLTMHSLLAVSLLAAGSICLASPDYRHSEQSESYESSYSSSRNDCNSSRTTYGASTHRTSSNTSSTGTCADAAVSFQLSDLPYENYFYSDCNTAAQVVVTSPQPGDNLTLIGPRLLVAWPAGNSGAVVFFAPENGVNGTLAIEVDNSTSNGALEPVYIPPRNGSDYPSVGVSGVLNLNDTAILNLAILGSIRTMRDFIEGPSLLVPEVQNALQYLETRNGGLTIRRVWLDNVTVTDFSFSPLRSGNSTGSRIQVVNRTATFEAGSYRFSAHFNYPQLDQLSPTEASASMLIALA